MWGTRIRAVQKASYGFGRGRVDFDGDGLRTEAWVLCGEADVAGLLTGSNPDRAGTADEGEGIIANEIRRPFDREGNGVVGLVA